jgi:gas vesicle protein
MESDGVLNTIIVGGICFGIGAATMYLLDPDRGRTRRAYVRDRATEFYNDSGDYLGKAGRDLVDRAKDVVTDAKDLVAQRSSEAAEGVELEDEDWALSGRIAAAAAGVALLLYGFRSKQAIARVAATAGIGLVARSISNRPVKDWADLLRPESILA